MLTAESESLFDTFLHGLSEVIKDELAARELPVDLNSLIALTIRIDGRLRESRSEKRSGLGHTCPSAMARSSPEAVFSTGSEATRIINDG